MFDLPIKTFYQYPDKKITSCLGAAPHGLSASWRFRPIMNCPIDTFISDSRDIFFNELIEKAKAKNVSLPDDIGQSTIITLPGISVKHQFLKIKPEYIGAHGRKMRPVITFQFIRSISSFTSAIESAIKAGDIANQ
ncbi:MAG: hypothetical protein ACI9T9_002158 [Oleiphilaceae bacterium]|jgi:hypothetical protein